MGKRLSCSLGSRECLSLRDSGSLFFISAYIAINLFSLICLIGKSMGIIRWIVIGLVVFLTAGLVYCVVGVLRLFRELPKSQQVSKGTMDEKEQKALLSYIGKLPSAETRWGIGENCSRVVRRAKWCIKQGVEYSKIENYVRDLQKIQIEAAMQFVKECAMQTGLKTAVCPWSTGDVLIVFINSYGVFHCQDLSPSNRQKQSPSIGI